MQLMQLVQLTRRENGHKRYDLSLAPGKRVYEGELSDTRGSSHAANMC